MWILITKVSLIIPDIVSILYHTMLILLFRPFFGWSLHSKLQDNALAVRAQKVCTEEATKVNEFFGQYERAFSFQNQTYLVSYCVYTAATIDIQQIRHECPALATAAANRLLTTLNMLESEAKQTPGIRRSIDIIRSHLNQRPHIAPEHAPPIGTLEQSRGSSGYSQTLYREPLITTPLSHDQLESPMQSAVRNTRANAGRFLGSPGPVEVVDSTRTQNVLPYEQIPEDEVGRLMSQAMNMNASWGNWEFFNAGGGFLPDDDGWSPFDTVSNLNMYQ